MMVNLLVLRYVTSLDQAQGTGFQTLLNAGIHRIMIMTKMLIVTLDYL
jgi:hypothetical protein